MTEFDVVVARLAAGVGHGSAGMTIATRTQDARDVNWLIANATAERALSAQLAEALRKFVAFRYLAGEPMYVNADDDTAARAALAAYEARNK